MEDYYTNKTEINLNLRRYEEMEILEFGDKNNKKIMLIHGFQSPYQVWNTYIEHYKNNFHVIVPILPGHNPKQREDFVSFSDIAKEIEDYYIDRYGDDLYAIFGMSMGGVLTATIWQNKRLNINKVVFDGSPLVSFHSVIKQMMLSFYMNITHKAQHRDKKVLNQAVKTIIAKENLEDFLDVLDNMSDTTIINCINNIADFRLSSSIDTKGTEIYYYYGTALNEMLAKKSAKYISKNYPDAVIKCFNGKSHCENSLFHPEFMIQELDVALK